MLYTNHPISIPVLIHEGLRILWIQSIFSDFSDIPYREKSKDLNNLLNVFPLANQMISIWHIHSQIRSA